MTREYTPLFDYQEFCELLDHIHTLKLLTAQYRGDADMYQKKIQQVCDRVERDFCDNHHFFTGWVDGKPVCLDSGNEVLLTADKKLIFMFLILNRRRELGLPIFHSDIEEFYKLCKQANTVFPKRYFEVV
mgnify:FL=1|jgi:hypothetical protein